MPDAAARPASLRFALALTALFAVAVGLGLARHEMWLDELQAWGIAASAGSVPDVLRHLTYEGHPPLWHLVLHGASRIWARPEAMQVVGGMVATATVFLVAWRSPFSPTQKALLAFGYFPLYEYGVIARSYGLGLLLIASFCALRHGGVRSPLALATPLALAAMTSIFGLIVAWGLALVVALDLWDDEGGPVDARAALAGAALLVGATALALRLMLPPADGSFAPGWLAAVDDARVEGVFSGVVRAFLPVPAPGSAQPWETNALLPGGQPSRLGLLLGAATLAAAAAALRGSPAALAGYVAAAAVLLGFSYVKYGLGLRHQGHHLVAWLACMWIARPAQGRLAAALAAFAALARPSAAARGLHPAGPGLLLGIGVAALAPAGLAAVLVVAMAGVAALALVAGWSPALRRLASGAAALRPGGAGLTALLAIHAAVGLWSWGQDLRHPFSAAKAIADAACAAAGPARAAPLFLADGRFTSYLGPPLAGYWGGPITYVTPDATWASMHLIWDQRRVARFELTAATALAVQRIAALVPADRPALLATEVPLLDLPAGLGGEVLAIATGGLLPDERPAFALYRVWRDPSQGAACPRPLAAVWHNGVLPGPELP